MASNVVTLEAPGATFKVDLYSDIELDRETVEELCRQAKVKAGQYINEQFAKLLRLRTPVEPWETTVVLNLQAVQLTEPIGASEK